MDTLARQRASALVVFGFALYALGTLILYLRILNASPSVVFSSGYEAIYTFAPPLIAVVTLWAWWMLTRLGNLSDEQADVLRRAFVGFAVVYGLNAALELASLIEFRSSPLGFWGWSSIWLESFGVVLTMAGFFMLARATNGRAERSSTLAPDAPTSRSVAPTWASDPHAPGSAGPARGPQQWRDEEPPTSDEETV